MARRQADGQSDMPISKTAGALVAIGTLISMVLGAFLWVNSTFVYASDYARQTAEISLEAQESMLQLRVELASDRIRRLRKHEATDTISPEEKEELQGLIDSRQRHFDRMDQVMESLDDLRNIK